MATAWFHTLHAGELAAAAPGMLPGLPSDNPDSPDSDIQAPAAGAGRDMAGIEAEPWGDNRATHRTAGTPSEQRFVQEIAAAVTLILAADLATNLPATHLPPAAPEGADAAETQVAGHGLPEFLPAAGPDARAAEPSLHRSLAALPGDVLAGMPAQDDIWAKGSPSLLAFAVNHTGPTRPALASASPPDWSSESPAPEPDIWQTPFAGLPAPLLDGAAFAGAVPLVSLRFTDADPASEEPAPVSRAAKHWIKPVAERLGPSSPAALDAFNLWSLAAPGVTLTPLDQLAPELGQKLAALTSSAGIDLTIFIPGQQGIGGFLGAGDGDDPAPGTGAIGDASGHASSAAGVPLAPAAPPYPDADASAPLLVPASPAIPASGMQEAEEAILAQALAELQRFMAEVPDYISFFIGRTVVLIDSASLHEPGVKLSLESIHLPDGSEFELIRAVSDHVLI
ncbi:MAG: hypothetical protein IRZ07_21375 [Microbispora sp.]|nr:hypothetical protein [Microbispora sp.]